MTTRKKPSKQQHQRGKPTIDQENRDQNVGQRDTDVDDESTAEEERRKNASDSDDRDSGLGEHGILSDDREVE